MITFEVAGKEFTMASSWSEVSLRQYLGITALQKKIGGFDIELIGGFLEILTGAQPGELDELTMAEMNSIVGGIGFISEAVPHFEGDHFVLNGIDYVIDKNPNNISIGELISIKTLMQDTEQSAYIPMMMAILVRPGKQKLNKESGKMRWVQDRFVTEGLQDRAEIFMDHLTVDKVVAVQERFFAGSSE